MNRVARSFQIATAATALAAALALHCCAGQTAYAQTLTGAADPVMQHALDRLNDRLDGLSDRVSWIQGIGTGAMSALFIMQTIGLLATSRAKKESS